MQINELFDSRSYEHLSDREKKILTAIVELHILRAAPIGSRYLSKYLEHDLKLSPATIRNVMSDLEENGFITHPHTSAGRIPTDKGYRFFVNNLNVFEILSDKELLALKKSILNTGSDFVLKEASKILGMLSKYLGIVRIPRFTELIVKKIELIELTSSRLLVVIALDSNIVRTVTLEAEFRIDPYILNDVSAYINEKISGKPLTYLRDNFEDMVSEFNEKGSPLIRLFTDSIDRIFEYQGMEDKLFMAGTQNLLTYPEFDNPDRIKGVIELIENEDIIIHLIDPKEESGSINVMIGKEMNSD
ncbi:MAG: heat-inducible transcriptional repressor HrcA, partial [Bacteroidota bacterium]